MKLFNSYCRGETPFEAKYGEETDRVFKIISEKQLKDFSLWELLVRQFSERYDCGDNGWRGEFWGKLMRGASLVYSYNKDEKLYEILRASVISLISYADGEGRLTTYPKEAEFKGWDMWVRKYVMLGLEYFYDICKEKELIDKIKSVLTGQADYILARIGKGAGKISVNDTSHAWGAVNSVSILQPVVKLYKLTGDKKYLRFAEYLIKEQGAEGVNIFALAYEDKLAPFEYPITKAYEIISCFEGLLDYYGETGEEKCLFACVRFAEKILATDFTAIGGTGCRDEYFDNSTAKQVLKTDINKQETCVTVTLMKFLASLYAYTGNAVYVDAIERSFLNLYQGALRNGEVSGYYVQPMFYSYSPVYDNPRWTLMGGGKGLSPYASFGCCVAIGAAGAGIIPAAGVIGCNNSVVVNLFYAGEYTLPGGCGAKIKIVTEYPDSGTVKIGFSETAAEGVNLKCRKPAWCGEFSARVNGENADFTEKQGYAVFGKPFFKGDVLEVNLNAEIKIISSEKVNPEVTDLFYMQKGPIVLCADSKDADLSKSYEVKTDCEGFVKYRRTGKGRYAVELIGGGELPVYEYRNTGKNFSEPENISVWLKK